HIKYSIENGNPSRQYRAAVFFETFEFHIRDIFIFEQFVSEFFQAFTSELFFVIAPAHIDTNLTTGLDRATGTDHRIPASFFIGIGNSGDFFTRRSNRFIKSFGTDLTILKISLGKGDTAHLHRFSMNRLELFTNNQLSRTATDVNHQTTTTVGHGMRNPEINQTGFFTSSNNFDWFG